MAERLPAFGEIADDKDLLDWDRARFGSFADAAGEGDDDAPQTVPYEPPEVKGMGARNLGIPDALRRFGLPVEVVPGWQTRGDSVFNPGGVLGHHTAGPRTGDRPCLRLVTDGRQGLSGPLCQVYLDRRGIPIVVAAGRANHAGKGGFRGLVGNSAVFGIEAESPGVEPNAWTTDQLIAFPKVVAALLWLIKRDDSWYCRHATWAPTRKIDTVSLSDNWMRDRVRPILSPPIIPPKGNPMDKFEAYETVDTRRLYAVATAKAVALTWDEFLTYVALDRFGNAKNQDGFPLTNDCTQAQMDHYIGSLNRPSGHPG